MWKAILATLAVTLSTTEAFVPAQKTQSSTQLFAQEGKGTNALFGAASLFVAGCIALAPTPAEAKYSTYTRRENDWQERVDKKEVQYTSARQLRQELREIVPQNTENSKIFCPNGPSANVSPLMENKCGDRMALPSVYGRTEDAVGNSIPGFSGGRYTEQMRGESSSLSAELGNVAYGSPTMRR